jgi:colanic acid biosynthesis protein WcaH
VLLSQDVFSCVVENTPLISIDLLVQNDKGQVLLGKRVNEPALGFWFVPGGRIFKDESLDAAFERTINAELGLEMKRTEAAFDKVYEHFYENNVFNTAFSTHYIVLAHKIKVDCFVPRNDATLVTASEARQSISANKEQHSQYKWFEVEELLEDENVHNYTKDYFR